MWLWFHKHACLWPNINPLSSKSFPWKLFATKLSTNLQKSSESSAGIVSESEICTKSTVVIIVLLVSFTSSYFTGEFDLNTKIRVDMLKYLETALTDRYVVKFTNNFLQRRSIWTGTVPIISILSQKFQFFKNYRSEDLSISRQFQVQFQFVFEHARCSTGPLDPFRPCSEPCLLLFG